MHKLIIKVSLLSAVVLIASANVQAQKKDKKEKQKKTKTEKVDKNAFQLKNQLDSVSYSVGLNMGASIKQEFSEAELKALMKGIEAAFTDTNYLITQEQSPEVIRPYFQKKQEAAQAEELKQFESVKANGLKFLEENKKNKDVKVTPSGLQYMVMKEGEGKQPIATSKVRVHYTGLTPDGTVFDSSVERGQPAEFGLNQVIPGWTEGVQLMKEGAKYKFFIPQELAYGANAPQGGKGPIKPFMPLVFEVELIKILD
ncbi:MAG: FKBP-type peptidylprolyl isomerase [Flavobacteriales bacterium]|jgi:FKBP-type peptidyl-prolyl cis-trans isomerase FklB|nr:FKBP-type peptidylprolyl isomerase [Flavobacteriales bacterium]|tara:strand:- start:66779 stop:67546 length:768 start_codon:yes stop_codon:yes gene_type:complete